MLRLCASPAPASPNMLALEPSVAVPPPPPALLVSGNGADCRLDRLNDHRYTLYATNKAIKPPMMDTSTIAAIGKLDCPPEAPAAVFVAGGIVWSDGGAPAPLTAVGFPIVAARRGAEQGQRRVISDESSV